MKCKDSGLKMLSVCETFIYVLVLSHNIINEQSINHWQCRKNGVSKETPQTKGEVFKLGTYEICSHSLNQSKGREGKTRLGTQPRCSSSFRWPLSSAWCSHWRRLVGRGVPLRSTCLTWTSYRQPWVRSCSWISPSFQIHGSKVQGSLVYSPNVCPSFTTRSKTAAESASLIASAYARRIA